MRVLVFCPTRRLEPETVRAIHALEGESVDFLFTRDNPHHAAGEQAGDRFGQAGRQNILHNYRKGRRAALDGGYDAMLCVESDIIPPPDALQKLLAIPQADLAFGAYMFRSGLPVLNICRWAMTPGCPDVSLYFHPGALQAAWGNVVRCTGLGLGCTLIHRRVLETIDFHPHPDNAHCDWQLAEDALSAGFQLWADLSVLCGHKRPDGVILWPTLRGWRETPGEVA